MATVTLKDLPSDIHRKLKTRAARHGRSLNTEMIACLRAAVLVEPVDVEALLARARAHRAAVRPGLDDDTVRTMRSAGRA